MYQLSAIYVYPIKSMGGISLKKTSLSPRGLAQDRRYMLVDTEGKFMTQRELPQMALFSLEIEEHGFSVTYNKDILSLPTNGEDWANTRKKVQIWGSSVTALLAPDAINAWFSDKLGKPCFLAYMPEKTRRSVPPHYAGKGHTVSFADGYPILLANSASLVDLERKVSEKFENTSPEIRLDRFRPNLVFEGKTPWEEDYWTDFSIGTANFKCAKPCARCPIVNTDQQTAKRSPEVLKTMAEFRKKGNKVLFGINVVWENFRENPKAIVEVGQEIQWA